MENCKEEKVTLWGRAVRRLTALALAAALALGLAACDASGLPGLPNGGSADVIPSPAASAGQKAPR